MPVFSARIPGLLKVGDRILVAGKIKENARKFSVNLCAEEGDEPRDVVLHFDVRFHRDNIISLSRKSGTWVGSGSYDTNCNLFVRGSLFRIVLELNNSNIITIYCQNKFHSNFLPKIPVAAARYVVVWEDVERVNQLHFYMGQHGNTREDSPLPRGMPPPPPMMDQTRSISRDDVTVPTIKIVDSYSSMPRNRAGMCANDFNRRQRTSSSSGSGDEEFQRRDTDMTLTDHTETRSEASRMYEVKPRGNMEQEYMNGVESDQQQSVARTASSVNSSIAVKKRGSFYNKARVPFQQVCDFVSKTRRTRKHR